MRNEPIDEHFKRFLEKISDVELFARAIKKSSETEFNLMVSNHQSLIDNGMERYSQSLHNMFFKALDNGEPIFYDFKSRGIEERKSDLVRHKNKQYLWLLAESFEYFEDLIEAIYAYMAFKNPTMWSAKELQNETPQTLATKPFDWYLKKAEKQGKLSAKLECLRKTFPRLKSVEENNSLGIDLHFTITLIEMLRHVIVHNGGRLKNKDEFIEKVFDKAGVANNGKFDIAKLEQTHNFIAKDSSGFIVTMLELPQEGITFYIDRLGAILNWTLAYGDFIYRRLIMPMYTPTAQ